MVAEVLTEIWFDTRNSVWKHCAKHSSSVKDTSDNGCKLSLAQNSLLSLSKLHTTSNFIISAQSRLRVFNSTVWPVSMTITGILGEAYRNCELDTLFIVCVPRTWTTKTTPVQTRVFRNPCCTVCLAGCCFDFPCNYFEFLYPITVGSTNVLMEKCWVMASHIKRY